MSCFAVVKLGVNVKAGCIKVDLSDYIDIAKMQHIVHWGGRYARLLNFNKSKKNKQFHVWVLERKLSRSLLPGEFADHINRDTRDNRRSNLRVATSAENNRNRSVNKSSKTGFKGVTVQSRSGLFRVRITVNGVSKYVGAFRCVKEAHEAYKSAAIDFYGEYASGE